MLQSNYSIHNLEPEEREKNETKENKQEPND